MIHRLLTVLVGAPLVLGTLFAPWPWVFKLFVQVCVSLALVEFFRIVQFSRREQVVAVVAGTLHSLFLQFSPAEGWFAAEAALWVVVGFAFFLYRHPPSLEGVAGKVALWTLGLFYVAGFGAFVGKARELPDGIFWALFLLAASWLNDTAAYFVGHRWGRRRLAPQVSPGKTVEGFLGGYVGSLAAFLLFWFLFGRPIPLSHGLVLVVLVGGVAPLGDLAESLLKRSFQVKDSGQIIPGHGGMLDRIDSLLFTAPLVYYYGQWLTGV